jgi:biotin carboxylase
VLRRRRVPYALWVDRASAVPPRGVRVEVAPYASSREAVADVCARFADDGPFTHCIAAVEAAVVAASRARRVLGARKSLHTVALRCHDKLVMKRRLRDAGLPVTDFADLGRAEGREQAAALGLPLVVKDRASSGSRGVEVVRDPAALPAALLRRNAMAERFITGEEMSVESFVHEGRVLWTSTTRYWRPRHVNVVPSGLDPGVLEEVLSLNRRTIEGLAIRWGMTHLELYRTADGPLVGEIALRPPGGYIMRCLELAWGFDPWEAVCAVELGETPVLPRRDARPTAVMVLHPGAGRVVAVRGLDEVRAHAAHVDTLLKVGVGSRVAARAGVGEDIGRVLLRADDRAALEDAIRFVDECLVVELEPAADD